MSDNDTLLAKLRGIYGWARSLPERLARIYRGEQTLPQPQEHQVPSREQQELQRTRQEETHPRIFFTDDDVRNAEIIDRIIAHVPTIESRLMDNADDDIYRRLIEQYRKKLGELKRKAPRGEKAAKCALDCVKDTILKMIDNSRFRAGVTAHLRDAGFELRSFAPGHKLDDEDLEMLDDHRMTSERTDDRAKRMTVIEMTQPIIEAAYDDDGEVRRRPLPGVCRVWS